MAGDASLQITWHVSNNSGVFFLGGAPGGPQLGPVPRTFATAAAAGDVRVQISDTNLYTGFFYVRSGNAGGFATRIIANEGGAPGWIRLLDPMPTSASIGDNVWSFRETQSTMPFGLSTAAECATGFVHHAGIYVLNSGSSLNNARIYLEELLPGPVVHEIAVASRPTTVYTLPVIANESVAPDLSSMLTSLGSGHFSKATVNNPNPGLFAVAGSSEYGLWIRKTSPVNHPHLEHAAVALVLEDQVAGVTSKVVLTWSSDGFTPVLTLEPSPSIYVGGGARYRAELRNAEFGAPVEGEHIDVVATALANGAFTAPADPSETDENGRVEGTYIASENPADAGSSITVEATYA